MNRNAIGITMFVAIAAFLLADTPAMAGLGLISKFSGSNLSNFDFYKILDQGTATNVQFSSPGSDLIVTSVGADGAEQVLFLHQTASLGVNEELQATGPPGPVNGPNDFGLAVGETPTDLGNGVAGDNRSLADYMFISYRNPNTQLNSRGFNGNAELSQVQAFGVNATKLYIHRTAANTAELGYYDNGVKTSVRSITVANTSIFNNVGFYVDLRANGAGYNGLDNLRIVPEPAGLALVGLGGLLMLIRRR